MCVCAHNVTHHPKKPLQCLNHKRNTDCIIKKYGFHDQTIGGLYQSSSWFKQKWIIITRVYLCFVGCWSGFGTTSTEFLSQEWWFKFECHRKIAMVILVPLWLAWWSMLIQHIQHGLQRGLRFVSFVSLLLRTVRVFSWASPRSTFIIIYLDAYMRTYTHIQSYAHIQSHAHIQPYTYTIIHKYIYRDYTTKYPLLDYIRFDFDPSPVPCFFCSKESLQWLSIARATCRRAAGGRLRLKEM